VDSSLEGLAFEIFAAHGRGIEATMAYYDADAVHREYTNATEAGEYRGRDAIFEFFRAFTDEFSSVQLQPVEVRQLSEDTVLSVIRFIVRGRASGAATESTECWLTVFSGGLIVEQEAHPDRRAALASPLAAPRRVG
jgi:ketosteroid isomerase-like protein